MSSYTADEATDQYLLFRGLQSVRIATDSRLAAAKGHTHQRGFPRHLHGQAGDFVEVHGGGHPDAALGRTECIVVPHEKDLRMKHPAVMHHGMDSHTDLLCRFDDAARNVLRQTESLRGLLDIP
jgi:hypothetical protein